MQHQHNRYCRMGLLEPLARFPELLWTGPVAWVFCAEEVVFVAPLCAPSLAFLCTLRPIGGIGTNTSSLLQGLKGSL